MAPSCNPSLTTTMAGMRSGLVDLVAELLDADGPLGEVDQERHFAAGSARRAAAE